MLLLLLLRGCGIVVFVDVGDSHVFRATVVLHHGSGLGDIRLLVVDHGGSGHGWGWRVAGAPVMSLTIAPVHIPAIPAPGWVRLAGLHQQHTRAKAQDACGNRYANIHHWCRGHIAVALIDGKWCAIGNAWVVLRHIDGAHIRRRDFDVLLRRGDHRVAHW